MPKRPPIKDNKPDSNITAAQIGIIAAILTLVGTVATAIFSYMSVRAPLELSIQTTQTAEARGLTLAPSSPKLPNATATVVTGNTLAPTKSVSPTVSAPTATPINALPIGQDFKNKCISDKLWVPYSSLQANQNREAKNGCWQLVEIGLAAETDGLLMTRQAAKEKGLFGIVAPIPETAVIEVTIKAEKLYGSIVKFGVLSDTKPDKQLKGAFLSLYDDGGVVLSTLDNGDETVVDQALIPCYPGYYSFRFEITKIRLNTVRYGGVCTDGTDISKVVTYQAVDVYFPNRNFFVGYETKPGSNVEAQIMSLSVQSK